MVFDSRRLPTRFIRIRHTCSGTEEQPINSLPDTLTHRCLLSWDEPCGIGESAEVRAHSTESCGSMASTKRANSEKSLNVLQSKPTVYNFERTLLSNGVGPLLRDAITTLQINVGKLCNQACQHCHVDAGPKRTESMSEQVAERLLQILSASPTITTVDITGGA